MNRDLLGNIMEKEEYIRNPTRSSALSYWKTKVFRTPPDMIVLNEEDYSDSLLADYNEELFFKMVCYPNSHYSYKLPENIVFVEANLEDFMVHINSCYQSEGVSLLDLIEYKNRPVYDKNLWICLYDVRNAWIVATGIAEYDDTAREGSLDWIQVSEEYRNQGFGKVIVYELLNRLLGKAELVTVAGRVDNQSKPELLYEHCGFRDKVIWHVLKGKG